MPLFALTYKDDAPPGLPEIIIADGAKTSRDGQWMIFTMAHPAKIGRNVTVYRAWLGDLVDVSHHGDHSAPTEDGESLPR